MSDDESTTMATEPPKRASGRIRKQPEMYTASPYASGGKRKRSNENNTHGQNESQDDDDSDESDDEVDEEPDEEELREQRRAARKPKSSAPKKPAQKKPKVNGASLPIRGASGSKKKSAKKAKALNLADAESAGGLFAEVFASGEALQDLAGQWLRRFNDHESKALAEVVNFVLRCVSSEGEVTDHDIEDPDAATNKLDDLREDYQASNPTEYPLIAKGKVATTYRAAITGFFHSLIKAMAVDGVLYNNPVLMENVQIWISTMSSAPNRAFRHTATVVALCIVTALCEVARECTEDIATGQRQAETEKKKSRVNQARVKQIEQGVREKKEAFETVEPQLKDWFDIVFIHRYRDVDPLIRRDCMVALGDWIATMPDTFFDGQHLRYLGWVLSDTSSATRLEVLKQLHRLYKIQDMLGGLKTFTEKFRPRMVEIATTDAETNVRVAGIELLDLLRENGLLEADDVDAVGRLIFDADPKVRKAVAGFFAENVNDYYNSKVDDLGGHESLEETLPEVGEDDNEAPRLEWIKLKSLAELLQTYDTDDALPSQIERNRADGSLSLQLGIGDSRFTLAADVLFEKIDEIQDWQMLAGYLLFDHSSGVAGRAADDPASQLKNETVLAEKEEAILIEVLHTSAKRTLTDNAEKISAPKSKLTKKQKDQIEEEQEETARNLANLIPKLLKKFGDTPSTAAAVLRVEAVLSLPALANLRQDSTTYGALLDDVRKQFMSHGSDEVLAPASDAILRAKSYGELDDLTEEKVAALWEDVINNLAELLNPETITVRGVASSEELTALSNNILRILRLSSVSNCIASLEDSSVAAKNDTSGVDYQGAIDYIIALPQRAIHSSGPSPDPDEAALEDEIAARAAEAALFYWRWKLKDVIATVASSSSGIPLDELEALATRRDAYVANIESALESRKPGADVSVRLAGHVLDLYSSSMTLKDIRPKPGANDDYTVLAMDMTPELQKQIIAIFAAAEKHYAKLAGKKLEEVGVDEEDEDAMNEDPMSDSESDEEDEDDAAQTQTQASQQRKESKLLNTLLAEQRLCMLTGKIVHALLANALDFDAVRKRLERNKAKLGHNFKEVLAYLDIDGLKKKAKSKASGKAKKPAANGLGTKAKAGPKSNAIVAEDEMEDDIEDPEAEDEEALRRRGLVEDNEREPEPDADEDVANAEQGEEESVVGD
ncbi:hypothetical protein D0863_06796 [Hortaea werneckii]|uniref:SCD domain-containing protein n=1 Tax=Hortaea werneckii TaxID=91943 RepID=A0A3M7DY95_HORWE|nr:hypothetical protein D0863_06796 [Hortaea werneckii]